MKFLITGRYKIKKNKAIYYLDNGWKSFFKNIKSNHQLYKEKIHTKKRLLKFDCLIVSGGGDIYKISKSKFDKTRDKLELDLINEFKKNNKPIILVCRGFQLLAYKYKNKISKIKNHVRTKNIIKIKKNSFTKVKQISTNSFHNYGFFNLNNKFHILGKTFDKSIELAEVRNKKILCMMFHPERYNDNQKDINNLIKNFINN